VRAIGGIGGKVQVKATKRQVRVEEFRPASCRTNHRLRGAERFFWIVIDPDTE
jgi:hypothetical protein